MTSPMSPAERAAALARCEAATEGPWTVGDHVRIVTMAPGYFWSAQHIPHGSGPQQVPDAAFIAHVRTDYLRLEATLRATEARADKAEAMLEAWERIGVIGRYMARQLCVVGNQVLLRELEGLTP